MTPHERQVRIDALTEGRKIINNSDWEPRDDAHSVLKNALLRKFDALINLEKVALEASPMQNAETSHLSPVPAEFENSPLVGNDGGTVVMIEKKPAS